jgi:hypothetical protein
MQTKAKQRSAADHFVDKVNSMDWLCRLLSREQS